MDNVQCQTPDVYVKYYENYGRCYACKREVRDMLHLHNHYRRYHWPREVFIAKHSLECQTTVCVARKTAERIVDDITPLFIQRKNGEDLTDYILRYVKEQNNA